MSSEFMIKKLQDVIEFVIDNRGRNPKSYQTNGIPVIDNYLITNEGKVNLDNVKRFIDEETYNTFLRKYIEKDDVLMTLVGNGYGQVAITPNEQCAIIQNTIGLRCNNLNFNKFLYYLLSNNRESLMNLNRGAAQPSIKVGDILELEFNFPPLPTQKKIAHVLSTLDDKIELNRKMNQTLESMASAIFKSWFVDFDPVHAKANCTDKAELENIAKELGISKEILDLFPSEFIESELGMIPKGWEIISFKNLVNKYIDNRGKTPPYQIEGIPLLEVRNLPKEILTPSYETDKYVTEETYSSWFRSHLEEDDVLISTVGTIGLTNIVPPNSKFTIAQNVLGIRANESHLEKKYMFYMMKSRKFLNDIEARLVTTVQSSIKRKDLETIDCLVPNKELQIKFISLIEPMLKIMQSDEIINLQKTRDILLPKLLSGEIDVSELKI